MLIVFHQSAIIYMKSLSAQLVFWLAECVHLVTFGLFWSRGTRAVCEREIDWRMFLCALLLSTEFWRVELLTGTSHIKPQDKVRGSLWSRSRRPISWSRKVDIRMEYRRFGRNVLRWKITPASLTRGLISIGKYGELASRRHELSLTDADLYLWEIWA